MVNRGGITSSAAALQFPRITTLGTLDGNQFHQARGNTATFDNEPVSNSDLLIKYTYYGDANFNGVVDGGDYAHIDTSFINEPSAGNIGGWYNGDFDYNGKVDGNDYALIDAAFNSQSGTLLRAISFLDGSDPDPTTMNTPALAMLVRDTNQFGESYRADFIAAVPEPTAAGISCAAVGLLLRRRRRGTNRFQR